MGDIMNKVREPLVDVVRILIAIIGTAVIVYLII